jgi:putative acetyltransferase
VATTVAPFLAPVSIEPLAQQHFEGVRAALDAVARERRFLAFTEAPTRRQSFAFYRSIIAGNGWQYVAVAGGQVLGWCDVLRQHGQARTHAGTLGIGLIATARHQGIGEQLMRTTIARALQNGITRIELTVRVDNGNARALYERLGFVHEGRMHRAFRIDGVYYDSDAMALVRDAVPLPDPAPAPARPI